MAQDAGEPRTGVRDWRLHDRPNPFDALIFGYYAGERLIYAARTATNEVFLVVLLTHENHVPRSLAASRGQPRKRAGLPASRLSRPPFDTTPRKVVLAHNHPGGVAQPSDEDLAVTRTLSGGVRRSSTTSSSPARAPSAWPTLGSFA